MWRRGTTSCGSRAIDLLLMKPHTRDVLMKSEVIEDVLSKGIQSKSELLVWKDPYFCGLNVTLWEEVIYSSNRLRREEG
jgi:hypothetical protein